MLPGLAGFKGPTLKWGEGKDGEWEGGRERGEGVRRQGQGGDPQWLVHIPPV